MNEIIRPGAGILFMKIGTHAQESLDKIISRKKKEIEDAGFAMWGYGGNTCHPQTMVQPFARSFEQHGRTIYLCTHEMVSKHFAEPVRADQFSEDGLNWKDVPAAISVLGSRYALIIRSLEHKELELPLAQTRVAIGNSQGLSGEQYVSGRVDKACLEVPENAQLSVGGPSIHIGLVAELKAPYAVYVRNRPLVIFAQNAFCRALDLTDVASEPADPTLRPCLRVPAAKANPKSLINLWVPADQVANGVGIVPEKNQTQ